MKHLPKHLQPRWRYLAVHLETWPDADLDQGTFQRHLWYSAQNLLGDTGSAELDLSVMRFQFAGATGKAIVRVRRNDTDRARAVLACLDRIDGSSVGLRVAGESGTIRACEEKYMGHGPEQPDKRYVAFGGAKLSAFVRGPRVDIETDEAFAGATNLDLQ